MNRRNRGKSQPQRGKKSFKGNVKSSKFTPKRKSKLRLNKTDAKEVPSIESLGKVQATATTTTPTATAVTTTTSSIASKETVNQHVMTARLLEKDVGITEYISKHEGFSGIIKQRFSDFHVNEIDIDGNVVILTSTSVPELPVDVDEAKKAEDYLKDAVPKDSLEKLKQLLESRGDDSVEIEVSDMSKEDRRKIHMAILKYGLRRLNSNTKERDGKKYITVSAKPDRRVSWPSERGGEYVQFVLHKENMDTMETVNDIAGKLRVKPNLIGYAGTKDRRAKTSQLMSVRRVEPSKLAKSTRNLRGVTLGNYTFKESGLKLGQLCGNRFRIVLRNVTGKDTQIKEAMTSLEEKGFINYFGLQRFGNSLVIPTYEIGKAILQTKWKEAVELILKPRDGEQMRDLSEARRVWWETRDAARALKLLRNPNKHIEGKLLEALSNLGPNNYCDALNKLPNNALSLYMHAYQSLLWNKVVSRRISEFGLHALAGDLVPKEGSTKAGGDDPAVEEDALNVTGSSEETSFSKKDDVREIGEKELTNIKIEDIVVPLPGYDITYPNNVTGEWMQELLKKDGLESMSFRKTLKHFKVGGTYRRLVIRPTNVKWKVMRYSDPQAALLLSDLEVMQNVPAPRDDPDGAYKALVLEFHLPSSCYATMALREILKTDTSVSLQASLNDYHIPKSASKSKENGAEGLGDSVTDTLENGSVSQEGPSKMKTRRNSSQKSESPSVKGKGKVISEGDKTRQEESRASIEEYTSPKKIKSSESATNKAETSVKSKGKRTAEHLDASVVKPKETLKKPKTVENSAQKLEETLSVKTRAKRSSDHLDHSASETEDAKEEKMELDDISSKKVRSENDSAPVKTRGRTTPKHVETTADSEEASSEAEEPLSAKKTRSKSKLRDISEGETEHEDISKTRSRAKTKLRENIEDVKTEAEDNTPIRTRSKGREVSDGNKIPEEAKTDHEDSVPDNPSVRTRSKFREAPVEEIKLEGEEVIPGNASLRTRSKAREIPEGGKINDEMKLESEDTTRENPTVRTRSKVREVSDGNKTAAEEVKIESDEGAPENLPVRTRSKVREASEGSKSNDEPKLDSEENAPVRTRSKAMTKSRDSTSESEGTKDDDLLKNKSERSATPSRVESSEDKPSVRTRSRAISKLVDSPALESEGGTEDEDTSSVASSPSKAKLPVRTRSKAKHRDSSLSDNDSAKVEPANSAEEGSSSVRTRSRVQSKLRDSPALDTDGSRDSVEGPDASIGPVRTRSRISSRSRDSPAPEKLAEDSKQDISESVEERPSLKTRTRSSSKASEAVSPHSGDNGDERLQVKRDDQKTERNLAMNENIKKERAEPERDNKRIKLDESVKKSGKILQSEKNKEMSENVEDQGKKLSADNNHASDKILGSKETKEGNGSNEPPSLELLGGISGNSEDGIKVQDIRKVSCEKNEIKEDDSLSCDGNKSKGAVEGLSTVEVDSSLGETRRKFEANQKCDELKMEVIISAENHEKDVTLITKVTEGGPKLEVSEDSRVESAAQNLKQNVASDTNLLPNASDDNSALVRSGLTNKTEIKEDKSESEVEISAYQNEGKLANVEVQSGEVVDHKFEPQTNNAVPELGDNNTEKIVPKEVSHLGVTHEVTGSLSEKVDSSPINTDCKPDTQKSDVIYSYSDLELQKSKTSAGNKNMEKACDKISEVTSAASDISASLTESISQNEDSCVLGKTCEEKMHCEDKSVLEVSTKESCLKETESKENTNIVSASSLDATTEVIGETSHPPKMLDDQNELENKNIHEEEMSVQGGGAPEQKETVNSDVKICCGTLGEYNNENKSVVEKTEHTTREEQSDCNKNKVGEDRSNIQGGIEESTVDQSISESLCHIQSSHGQKTDDSAMKQSVAAEAAVPSPKTDSLASQDDREVGNTTEDACRDSLLLKSKDISRPIDETSFNENKDTALASSGSDLVVKNDEMPSGLINTKCDDILPRNIECSVEKDDSKQEKDDGASVLKHEPLSNKNLKHLAEREEKTDLLNETDLIGPCETDSVHKSETREEPFDASVAKVKADLSMETEISSAENVESDASYSELMKPQDVDNGDATELVVNNTSKMNVYEQKTRVKDESCTKSSTSTETDSSSKTESELIHPKETAVTTVSEKSEGCTVGDELLHKPINSIADGQGDIAKGTILRSSSKPEQLPNEEKSDEIVEDKVASIYHDETVSKITDALDRKSESAFSPQDHPVIETHTEMDDDVPVRSEKNEQTVISENQQAEFEESLKIEEKLGEDESLDVSINSNQHNVELSLGTERDSSKSEIELTEVETNQLKILPVRDSCDDQTLGKDTDSSSDPSHSEVQNESVEIESTDAIVRSNEIVQVENNVKVFSKDISGRGQDPEESASVADEAGNVMDVCKEKHPPLKSHDAVVCGAHTDVNISNVNVSESVQELEKLIDTACSNEKSMAPAVTAVACNNEEIMPGLDVKNPPKIKLAEERQEICIKAGDNISGTEEIIHRNISEESAETDISKKVTSFTATESLVEPISPAEPAVSEPEPFERLNSNAEILSLHRKEVTDSEKLQDVTNSSTLCESLSPKHKTEVDSLNVELSRRERREICSIDLTIEEEKRDMEHSVGFNTGNPTETVEKSCVKADVEKDAIDNFELVKTSTVTSSPDATKSSCVEADVEKDTSDSFELVKTSTFITSPDATVRGKEHVMVEIKNDTDMQTDLPGDETVLVATDTVDDRQINSVSKEPSDISKELRGMSKGTSLPLAAGISMPLQSAKLVDKNGASPVGEILHKPEKLPEITDRNKSVISLTEKSEHAIDNKDEMLVSVDLCENVAEPQERLGATGNVKEEISSSVTERPKEISCKSEGVKATSEDLNSKDDTEESVSSSKDVHLPATEQKTVVKSSEVLHSGRETETDTTEPSEEFEKEVKGTSLKPPGSEPEKERKVVSQHLEMTSSATEVAFEDKSLGTAIARETECLTEQSVDLPSERTLAAPVKLSNTSVNDNDISEENIKVTDSTGLSENVGKMEKTSTEDSDNRVEVTTPKMRTDFSSEMEVNISSEQHEDAFKLSTSDATEVTDILKPVSNFNETDCKTKHQTEELEEKQEIEVTEESKFPLERSKVVEGMDKTTSEKLMQDTKMDEAGKLSSELTVVSTSNSDEGMSVSIPKVAGNEDETIRVPHSPVLAYNMDVALPSENVPEVTEIEECCSKGQISEISDETSATESTLSCNLLENKLGEGSTSVGPKPERKENISLEMQSVKEIILPKLHEVPVVIQDAAHAEAVEISKTNEEPLIHQPASSEKMEESCTLNSQESSIKDREDLSLMKRQKLEETELSEALQSAKENMNGNSCNEQSLTKSPTFPENGEEFKTAESTAVGSLSESSESVGNSVCSKKQEGIEQVKEVALSEYVTAVAESSLPSEQHEIVMETAMLLESTDVVNQVSSEQHRDTLMDCVENGTTEMEKVIPAKQCEVSRAEETALSEQNEKSVVETKLPEERKFTTKKEDVLSEQSGIQTDEAISSEQHEETQINDITVSEETSNCQMKGVKLPEQSRILHTGNLPSEHPESVQTEETEPSGETEEVVPSEQPIVTRTEENVHSAVEDTMPVDQSDVTRMKDAICSEQILFAEAKEAIFSEQSSDTQKKVAMPSEQHDISQTLRTKLSEHIEVNQLEETSKQNDVALSEEPSEQNEISQTEETESSAKAIPVHMEEILRPDQHEDSEIDKDICEPSEITHMDRTMAAKKCEVSTVEQVKSPELCKVSSQERNVSPGKSVIAAAENVVTDGTILSEREVNKLENTMSPKHDTVDLEEEALISNQCIENGMEGSLAPEQILLSSKNLDVGKVTHSVPFVQNKLPQSDKTEPSAKHEACLLEGTEPSEKCEFNQLGKDLPSEQLEASHEREIVSKQCEVNQVDKAAFTGQIEEKRMKEAALNEPHEDIQREESLYTEECKVTHMKEYLTSEKHKAAKCSDTQSEGNHSSESTQIKFIPTANPERDEDTSAEQKEKSTCECLETPRVDAVSEQCMEKNVPFCKQGDASSKRTASCDLPVRQEECSSSKRRKLSPAEAVEAGVSSQEGEISPMEHEPYEQQNGDVQKLVTPSASSQSHSKVEDISSTEKPVIQVESNEIAEMERDLSLDPCKDIGSEDISMKHKVCEMDSNLMSKQSEVSPFTEVTKYKFPDHKVQREENLVDETSCIKQSESSQKEKSPEQTDVTLAVKDNEPEVMHVTEGVSSVDQSVTSPETEETKPQKSTGESSEQPASCQTGGKLSESTTEYHCLEESISSEKIEGTQTLKETESTEQLQPTSEMSEVLERIGATSYSDEKTETLDALKVKSSSEQTDVCNEIEAFSSSEQPVVSERMEESSSVKQPEVCERMEESSVNELEVSEGMEASSLEQAEVKQKAEDSLSSKLPEVLQRTDEFSLKQHNDLHRMGESSSGQPEVLQKMESSSERAKSLQKMEELSSSEQAIVLQGVEEVVCSERGVQKEAESSSSEQPVVLQRKEESTSSGKHEVVKEEESTSVKQLEILPFVEESESFKQLEVLTVAEESSYSNQPKILQRIEESLSSEQPGVLQSAALSIPSNQSDLLQRVEESASSYPRDAVQEMEESPASQQPEVLERLDESSCSNQTEILQRMEESSCSNQTKVLQRMEESSLSCQPEVLQRMEESYGDQLEVLQRMEESLCSDQPKLLQKMEESSSSGQPEVLQRMEESSSSDQIEVLQRMEEQPEVLERVKESSLDQSEVLRRVEESSSLDHSKVLQEVEELSSLDHPKALQKVEESLSSNQPETLQKIESSSSDQPEVLQKIEEPSSSDQPEILQKIEEASSSDQTEVLQKVEESSSSDQTEVLQKVEELSSSDQTKVLQKVEESSSMDQPKVLQKVEESQSSGQPEIFQKMEDSSCSDQSEVLQGMEESSCSVQPKVLQRMEESSYSDQPEVLQKMEESSCSDQPEVLQKMEESSCSDQPEVLQKMEESSCSEQPEVLQKMEESSCSEQPEVLQKMEESSCSEQPEVLQKMEEASCSDQPKVLQKMEESSSSDQPEDLQKMEESSSSDQPEILQKMEESSSSDQPEILGKVEFSSTDEPEVLQRVEELSSDQTQVMQRVEELSSDQTQVLQRVEESSSFDQPEVLQRVEESTSLDQPEVLQRVEESSSLDQPKVLQRVEESPSLDQPEVLERVEESSSSDQPGVLQRTDESSLDQTKILQRTEELSSDRTKVLQRVEESSSSDQREVLQKMEESSSSEHPKVLQKMEESHALEEANILQQMVDSSALNQPEILQGTEESSSSKQPEILQRMEESSSSDHPEVLHRVEESLSLEQPKVLQRLEESSEQPEVLQRIKESSSPSHFKVSQRMEESSTSEQPEVLEKTEQPSSLEQPEVLGLVEESSTLGQPKVLQRMEESLSSEQPTILQGKKDTPPSEQPEIFQRMEKSSSLEQPEVLQRKKETPSTEQPEVLQKMEEFSQKIEESSALEQSEASVDMSSEQGEISITESSEKPEAFDEGGSEQLKILERMESSPELPDVSKETEKFSSTAESVVLQRDGTSISSNLDQMFRPLPNMERPKINGTEELQSSDKSDVCIVLVEPDSSPKQNKDVLGIKDDHKSGTRGTFSTSLAVLSERCKESEASSLGKPECSSLAEDPEPLLGCNNSSVPTILLEQSEGTVMSEHPTKTGDETEKTIALPGENENHVTEVELFKEGTSVHTALSEKNGKICSEISIINNDASNEMSQKCETLKVNEDVKSCELSETMEKVEVFTSSESSETNRETKLSKSSCTSKTPDSEESEVITLKEKVILPEKLQGVEKVKDGGLSEPEVSEFELRTSFRKQQCDVSASMQSGQLEDSDKKAEGSLSKKLATTVTLEKPSQTSDHVALSERLEDISPVLEIEESGKREVSEHNEPQIPDGIEVRKVAEIPLSDEIKEDEVLCKSLEIYVGEEKKQTLNAKENLDSSVLGKLTEAPSPKFNSDFGPVNESCTAGQSSILSPKAVEANDNISATSQEENVAVSNSNANSVQDVCDNLEGAEQLSANTAQQCSIKELSNEIFCKQEENLKCNESDTHSTETILDASQPSSGRSAESKELTTSETDPLKSSLSGDVGAKEFDSVSRNSNDTKLELAVKRKADEDDGSNQDDCHITTKKVRLPTEDNVQQCQEVPAKRKADDVDNTSLEENKRVRRGESTVNGGDNEEGSEECVLKRKSLEVNCDNIEAKKAKLEASDAPE